MHVVIRRYTGAQQLVTAMQQKSGDVERVIRAVPGFRAYYVINNGGDVASITICDDKAGTDASIQAAAGWIRDNLPPSTINPPEVFEGDTYIQFSA
jgi:hypothetical protein